MNRKSFMAELRSLLAFLDAAERDRVLNRYERMFDEAGPEGEAAVIRCFGSPVRQVLQIEREYREAVANGETPFADGEAAEPEEAPEETEIIEEEYTGVHSPAAETAPEAEELPGELIEEKPEEPMPQEESAAEPEPDVLPELDLDDLDFSDLGLTFPKQTAVSEEPEEPETPAEIAEAEEPAPDGSDDAAEETPETEPAEDEPFAEPAAEDLPEETDESAASEEPERLPEPEASVSAEEASEEPEAGEAAEPEEAEEAETPDASEETEPSADTEFAFVLPADTEFTIDLPAEDELSFDDPEEEEEIDEEAEPEEEYEYEEIEDRRPVSGGRAFAAVMVTIPMLAVWALLFGLSLGLGVAVLAIGAALAAAGVYLAGYVFNGAIVLMPDLLLTAGAALAVFALALLLVWAGISIAVAGCTLTVRLTRSIYRSILYPKKEANGDE